MLSPSKNFGFALLLGGQHARLSVSPTRPRTARPHHRPAVAAPAAGGLLRPLHGAAAAVLPGPGRCPPPFPGRRGRRAPLLPVARDLAAGPVRHLAGLRRPAPPYPGAAPRL